MPIRVEKMKMPATVTTRETMRKLQPASPPMVPASIERISDSQMASGKLSGEPPSWAMPSRVRTAPATTMTITDSTASQPIRAIGPAAMDLSNS